MDVDVVITWVDGNDTSWQIEKNKYKEPVNECDIEEDTRFRDWDNLQYILRGIEEFMPWVRKVHLVTWGHLPKWINKECPKLNIVKHEDFIPEKYLPTFNSNTIDLNLHRIDGLAEHFIYFNDDMFVVKPTTKQDFFVEGKPRDMAAISPQPVYRDTIMNIELNNLKVLSDYFTIGDVKKNKRLWVKPFMYKQYAVRTFIFSKFKTIIGIFQPHVPYAFTKETFATIWDKEYDLLDTVCSNKFRTTDDVNIWMMRSWQLLSANFVPRSPKFGQLMSASDIEAVKYFTSDKSKCKVVCINDDKHVDNFTVMRDAVNKVLDNLLPEKCTFEK